MSIVGSSFCWFIGLLVCWFVVLSFRRFVVSSFCCFVFSLFRSFGPSSFPLMVLPAEPFLVRSSSDPHVHLISWTTFFRVQSGFNTQRSEFLKRASGHHVTKKL